MSPQVFRGRTVIEAHRAALEQLGPEAVVLTTRSVARSGVRGWFGASDIELAATLPQPSSDTTPAPSLAARFAPGVYATVAAARSTTADVAALRAELKSDIRSLKTMIARTADSGDLAAEIAQLRDLVEGIAGAKPRRDKTVTHLQSLGLEGPALGVIVRALKGKPEGAAAVRDELGRALQVAAWPLEQGPVLIAMVGPSGVGKTTTAAKLGARARMDGKTVTFVACDTYRVGAAEQLARYADLMGAELKTARTSDELRAVIDAARTDVVIVDTSGRPPTADGVEIALAPRCFPAPRPGSSPRKRHVLLCVPATLRSNDATRLVKRYGAAVPTSIVVTKIDETDAPAGIVHASWASKLPVSVMCFGQRVPEDIAPATIGALVDYVAPRRDGEAVSA
jgi:flagellar biosynthesis protein FlhF